MEDELIDVGGTRVRYRDTGGDGVPVVCSHGIGLSLEFWDTQLAELGDRHRLIAWDMPGHGESDLGDQPYDFDSFADFGWRLLDALGVERVHLVGNSMGAAVSIRMAGAQPDRVATVVAADSAALGSEVFFVFRLMTLKPLGELMTRPGPAGLKQQLKGIFRDPAVVDDGLRAAMMRNLEKPGGAQAFLATLRAMTSLRGQRAESWHRTHLILRGLDIPVLFVHGRQDQLVPAQHSIDAAEMTPDSTLVLIDDCGHAPQVEKPAQFNRALLEHLAG